MNDYILDGVGKNERKPVLLTDYQAKFLDHLLYKEQSYLKKRGIYRHGKKNFSKNMVAVIMTILLID